MTDNKIKSEIHPIAGFEHEGGHMLRSVGSPWELGEGPWLIASKKMRN